MRNRPEDIYKKDLLPRFSRRRRQSASDAVVPRRAPDTEGTPGLPPDDSPPSPGPGFRSTPPPHFGGRPERRRRRGRSGTPGAARFNGLAVAGLVSVLVLYIGLAAFFKFRRKGEAAAPAVPAGARITAPAAPGPATASTNAVENLSAGAFTAEMADAHIREIKASLSFLDKLDEHPLNRNAPEENIRLCEERLRATPGMQELLLELARRHFAANQPARAAEYYRRVLEGNPGNREARIALAQAHLKAKEYGAAIAVAKWVLELESFSLDAQQVLASVYLAQNQPRNAVPHLRAIVEGDSINVVARNNLAVAYTQIGEYDKAIKMFRGVIGQEENNPVSYNNLAICLARKNDLVEAAAVLRQAADRFGYAFVAAWIKGRDFDEVRNTLPIQNLLHQLDPLGSGADPSGGILLDGTVKKPVPSDGRNPSNPPK